MAGGKTSDARLIPGVQAKAPAEISVENFSGLVANLSRILAGVSRFRPFDAADLGLAEWVALMTLIGNDGISNKLLARHLGVTRQRANQIVIALEREDLIEVTQSAEDQRVNEIKVSDFGKSTLEVLNLELKPLLATTFEGKERAVTAMAKHARQVVQRVVHANNSSRLARQKAAEAAQSAV